MATYHLNVRGCSKAKGQSASAKYDYINREDKYAKNKDDLVYSSNGNIPGFAQDNPKDFWKSADEFERANARVCTEIEFALPRELDLEQQKELINEFIRKNLDNDHHKLTYSYAIHNEKDNHNPHCHLIFSERNNDGIERTAEQFFRRANNKEPNKGGAKKSEYAHKKDFVQEVRTSWRESANEHLAKAGFNNRIDERTLEAQGIDRESPRRLNRVEFKQLREMEKELAFTDVLLNHADNLIAKIKKEEPLKVKPQLNPIEAYEQPKKAQEEQEEIKDYERVVESKEIDFWVDKGFLAYKTKVFEDLVMDKRNINQRHENETNTFIETATKVQKEFDGYQSKKIHCESIIDQLKKENSQFFILPSTKSHNKWHISELEKELGSANYFMERLTKENGKYLNINIDEYRQVRMDKLSDDLNNHDMKSKEIARNIVEKYKESIANPPIEKKLTAFERAKAEVLAKKSTGTKKDNDFDR